MVHHIVLLKLKSSVTAEKLDEMIRSSRSQLLKIPEVLSLSSGKNIELNSEWAFFIAMDLESTAKLRMCEDDAVYVKFVEDFPLTVTGKVKKFRMREMAVQELGLGESTTVSYDDEVPDEGAELAGAPS